MKRQIGKVFLGLMLWFGLLFGASTLAQAECFTAERAEAEVKNAGGVVLYVTGNHAAIEAAKTAVDAQIEGVTRAVMYGVGQAVAITFYNAGGCMLDPDGKDTGREGAALYPLSKQQALELVRRMETARSRSEI